MEDKDIIKLFFKRDEQALTQTDKQYGKYARFIAGNILPTAEDSEEAVNDAYVSLWQSIPPKEPLSLKAYLARVVKNISLDRLRHQRAEKRGAGQTDSVLEELSECLSDNDTPESELDKKLLSEAIERFVDSLDKKNRIIFIRRYWYLCSVEEIASSQRMTKGSVKTALYRMRLKLKEQLEREGLL